MFSCYRLGSIILVDHNEHRRYVAAVQRILALDVIRYRPDTEEALEKVGIQ